MSKVLQLYDSGRVPKRGDMPPIPPGDDPPDRGDPWIDPPFEVLGKSGLHYWFIDRTGEIIALHASALGQWPSLVTLCGGDDWLIRNWQSVDKEGQPVHAFNGRRAATDIMTRCANEPLFDELEPRRRYGLWPIPGGSALHLGRRVVWLGKDRDAGFRDASALWPRLAPRPAPAAPSAPEIARELETLLRRWNWSHKDAPSVLLRRTGAAKRLSKPGFMPRVKAPRGACAAPPTASRTPARPGACGAVAEKWRQ